MLAHLDEAGGVSKTLGALIADPAQCDAVVPHFLRQLQWSRALLRGLDDVDLGALLGPEAIAEVPPGLVHPDRIERALAAAAAAEQLEQDVAPSSASMRTVFDAEAGVEVDDEEGGTPRRRGAALSPTGGAQRRKRAGKKQKAWAESMKLSPTETRTAKWMSGVALGVIVCGALSASPLAFFFSAIIACVTGAGFLFADNPAPWFVGVLLACASALWALGGWLVWLATLGAGAFIARESAREELVKMLQIKSGKGRGGAQKRDGGRGREGGRSDRGGGSGRGAARSGPRSARAAAAAAAAATPRRKRVASYAHAEVSFLCTVTFHANLAHSLTRSP